jgi:hypothetical protein
LQVFFCFFLCSCVLFIRCLFLIFMLMCLFCLLLSCRCQLLVACIALGLPRLLYNFFFACFLLLPIVCFLASAYVDVLCFALSMPIRPAFSGSSPPAPATVGFPASTTAAAGSPASGQIHSPNHCRRPR